MLKKSKVLILINAIIFSMPSLLLSKNDSILTSIYVYKSKAEATDLLKQPLLNYCHSSMKNYQSELPKPSTIKNSNGDLNNNPPSVSGPIEVFPWDNDEKFKKAIDRYGTNTLLAGYCTVLNDPLPGEEENVHIAADLLAGTIVQPGHVFSQNRELGPYTEERGFKKGPTYMGSRLITTIGGGVCKIASTLYNVTILSNLQVVERHSHSMPVPYVPYGQDATVSYGTRDYKLRNNTSDPLLIWAKGIDNVLYIGFYGKSKPPKVEWHHETLGVEKAPKVYRKNSTLPPGKEKLVLEGMDGATVKSWITIKNPDGTSTVTQLGISYYRPMPHIYEINK